MNKITLKRDIADLNSKPIYIENSYEFPYDADLNEMFHLFKQILIALTYSESTIEKYMKEYDGEV